MTWDEIGVQWSHVTRQAHLKWPKLTTLDLVDVAGDRERMIDKLTERYGLSSELGGLHVDEWAAYEATLKNAAPEARRPGGDRAA